MLWLIAFTKHEWRMHYSSSHLIASIPGHSASVSWYTSVSQLWVLLTQQWRVELGDVQTFAPGSSHVNTRFFVLPPCHQCQSTEAKYCIRMKELGTSASGSGRTVWEGLSKLHLLPVQWLCLWVLAERSTRRWCSCDSVVSAASFILTCFCC